MTFGTFRKLQIPLDENERFAVTTSKVLFVNLVNKL